MPITQTIGALGSWTVNLKADTPQEIVDQFQDGPNNPAYFGHLVIHSGRINSVLSGDSLLRSSRYTGVYRGFQRNINNTIDLTGVGMAVWLGDEDQKGAVIENVLTLTNSPLPATINALLPVAVNPGTLFDIGQNFTGTFQYIDPRSAIDYVCNTLGAEYRVNGDATIDAGTVDDLYRTIPVCSLVARDSGVDMFMKGFSGAFQTAEDVDDFSTRVVLLAQGEGGATATAGVNINPSLNPYIDLFGNPLERTRLVSESTTDSSNATARAQLALNQFTSPREALTLSTSDYDIQGDLSVGDNLYIFDPDQKLIDSNNEIIFRGQRINPIILRCTESTWPVVKGFSVAFRNPRGTWIDLTDHVTWEQGTSTIVVGGYNRSLVSGGEPVGSRPIGDASIPDKPTWTTPFVQSVYQSVLNGQTRAQVQLHWTRPNNTDGTSIIDGDHYEIRYRQSSSPIYRATWNQLATLTWNQIKGSGGTWNQPIQYPVGPWQLAAVGFDQLTFMLEELLPSHPYEAQIRAVDCADPPNFGDWSDLTTWQTSDDTIPPHTPAPPEVASSLIAVQVTHYLGVDSGGQFNLDADLHHLEVHGQYEPLFSPDDSTLLGKLLANSGMINGEIPVVGTFQVGSTAPVYFKVIAVDTAGNKSNSSGAVQASADLIDNEHISDLTVSKLTSGSITADTILSGSIKTANSGARVEMNNLGLWGFDRNNSTTFHLSDTDGSVTVNLTDDSPGSGLTVTTDGITKFHTGVDQTVLRDQSGNVLIADDVTAGWGYTTPNMIYSSGLDTASIPQLKNFAPNTGWVLWMKSTFIANNPRIVGQYFSQLFYSTGSSGSSSSCQFRARLTIPGMSDVILQSNSLSVNASSGQATAAPGFNYLLPSDVFGEQLSIYWELQPTSGNTGISDIMLTYIFPFVLYGAGA